MNVNSHCIDLLVYIFGTPVKVSSFINREQGTETENVSIVMVEFEKGVLATAQGSDMEETRPSNLEIFGGRGSLIVEGACSTDRTGTIQNLPGYIPEKTEFPESPYTLEIDHFARAIKEGFEPISSGRENLKTMEIVMAAYRSAETGRHICLQNR